MFDSERVPFNYAHEKFMIVFFGVLLTWLFSIGKQKDERHCK